MKLLVAGGDGLLAFALRCISPPEFQLLLLDRREFDITQPQLMSAQLNLLAPDAVINTAAYNLVDHCEVERELSWRVNAQGPQELARICAQRGIPMVHYGTDYIFDGCKRAPYSETDPANPVNHYAAGKLAGEAAVLAASNHHLVLRTSWLFDWHPTQTKSYVHTILRAAQAGKVLRGATDQMSVPTLATDLARWTLDLLRIEASGVFHAVNDDAVSRLDWTREIVAQAHAAGLLSVPVPVEPVLGSYFNTSIRRPDYTVMSNKKLSGTLGYALGSWRPGLRKVLAQLKTTSLL